MPVDVCVLGVFVFVMCAPKIVVKTMLCIFESESMCKCDTFEAIFFISSLLRSVLVRKISSWSDRTVFPLFARRQVKTQAREIQTYKYV